MTKLIFSQITTIVQLLTPIPAGAYWTGGKITKYTQENANNPNETTSYIKLTWTDHRIGSPSVLGMTKENADMLETGFTYCLALDLSKQMWQARECHDRLPYACLLTQIKTTFRMVKHSRTKLSSNKTLPSLNTTSTNSTLNLNLTQIDNKTNASTVPLNVQAMEYDSNYKLPSESPYHLTRKFSAKFSAIKQKLKDYIRDMGGINLV